jgi:molecular chaperone Hsp33
VLAEQGQVEVGCEFCGRQYRYGEAEINELFAGATAAPGSGRLQ